MPIKEILKDTDEKMKKSLESARREFSEVRTGRAHPGIVEGIQVDYFGTPTPIKQMASISVPDPRSIMIQPWDVTAIVEIEKAISNSNLGISPSNDGKVIRINIPQLSEERRNEMIKIVKDMAEKSKISLRTVRREANDQIKKMESDKSISEDDSFKAHENVQKMTDTYTKDIDVILEEKSKSLLEV